MRNLRSTLPKRRRAQDPMREYDRLPPALRRWLAQAALPWSARSVRRLWQRALKEYGGSEEAAIAYLNSVESRQLRKDREGSPTATA